MHIFAFAGGNGPFGSLDTAALVASSEAEVVEMKHWLIFAPDAVQMWAVQVH